MRWEKLKKLYERYPDSYDRQTYYIHLGGCSSKPEIDLMTRCGKLTLPYDTWYSLPKEDDFWSDGVVYRLYPIIPFRCVEPSSEMITNNALYIGTGPISLPPNVSGFEGWMLKSPESSGIWIKGNFSGLVSGYHYCIDPEYEFAEAIYMLNAFRQYTY